MSKSGKTKINERAQHLLKMLIERYLRDGQPVGSKTLSESKIISLSSATVRNVLADLEAAGFLRSPHTSAGRIPTLLGLRFFVDSLMTVKPFAEVEIETLKQHLQGVADAKSLAASASSILSSVTQLAGIVTVPKRQQNVLRHVEFLPLSANRILVILVLNNHEVQNRIIYTDRNYSASELQQAANYLIDKYSGFELNEVRQALLHAMHKDRDNLEYTAQAIVDIADEAFAQKNDDDFVVAGESNLLDMVDEAGVVKLRNLFSAFNSKRDVLHLLDKCLHTEGVQIYIGEESGYDAFNDVSVVTKPYEVDSKLVGVLGVIGPTRMNYDRAVSAVDITSKLLSLALSEH